MNRINLGIIGFGKWVREAYIPILRALPQYAVTAIAARTEQSRNTAREELGSGVHIHEEYTALLADPAVDAVAVALPNHLHAAAIEAAIKTGKHVFFEPPPGLDLAAAQNVLDLMSKAKRVVQPDLELRCLPVMDWVREQIASGQIGEPLTTRIRLWCDWGLGRGPWVEEVGDQGFFPWLGWWYLELIDWVYQTLPLSAGVTGGYAMNGPIMDYGQALLQFSGRRIGVFEFSLIAMEGTQITFSVAGTAGELEADLLTGIGRCRGPKQPWQETPRPCSQPIHGFHGMRESLTDFAEAVLHGKQPRSDLEVCRRVHAAVVACSESEASGQIAPVKTL